MSTSLPAASYLSNAGRTVAEMKAALDAQRNFIANMIGGGARSSVTISSGSVTPTDGASGGWIVVDTESAAASDDLTNIVTTNVPDGGFLYISIANAARVVTVKNNAGGSGQIQLIDGADFVMNATDLWLFVQRRGTDIFEVDRGYGSSFQAMHDFLRIASVPGHNTLCPHSRLRLDYASASTVTVAADAVVLADSSGRLKRFNNLSETLNIGNTGANGRDVTENAGAEQASVWYHTWAIGKTDGTLDVFATQACYPGGSSIYSVLPSGYAWAGYIGAVYNDSGSNLIAFQQRGDIVTRTQLTVVSNGAATTMTSVSLAAAIPQSAREVRVLLSVLNSTGSFVAVNGNLAANSGGGYGSVSYYAPYVANGNGAGSSVDLIILTAQTIWYNVTSGGRLTAVVTGWRF